MGLIGPSEALLIGAAVIGLIWGPKKLPQLARAIGRSKQAYRDSVEPDEDADA